MAPISPARHLAYLPPGRRLQLPSCLNFCAARTFGRFTLHGPISISMVSMFLAPLLQRSDLRIFAVATGEKLQAPDPGAKHLAYLPPGRRRQLPSCLNFCAARTLGRFSLHGPISMSMVSMFLAPLLLRSDLRIFVAAARGDLPAPPPGNPFDRKGENPDRQIGLKRNTQDLKLSKDSPDLMLASRLFERPATSSLFVDLTYRLGPVLLKRLEELSAMDATESSEVGLEIADSLYILKLLCYSHPQLEIVREKALKGALLLLEGEAILREVQNLVPNLVPNLVRSAINV